MESKDIQSKASNTKNLLDLPKELLILLLLFMNSHEINVVSMISKKMNEIANSSFLWFKLFQTLCKQDSSFFNSNLSYKNLSFFYQDAGKDFQDKGFKKIDEIGEICSGFRYERNLLLSSEVNGKWQTSGSVVNIIFDTNNLKVLIEKANNNNQYVLREFGLKPIVKKDSQQDGFIPYLKIAEINDPKIKNIIKSGKGFNFKIGVTETALLENIVKHDLMMNKIFCPQCFTNQFYLIYEYLLQAISKIDATVSGRRNLLIGIKKMPTLFKNANTISSSTVVDILTDSLISKPYSSRRRV